ncbi:MAG TPA: cytochrome c [Candidatus Xenobia bacterium]
MKTLLLGLALLLLTGRAGAADGKALWVRDCVACHGMAGNGVGHDGQRLNPQVHQDLGSPQVQARLSDRMIHDAICGCTMMRPPGHRSTLSPAEVQALVSYTRSLKRAAAPQPLR